MDSLPELEEVAIIPKLCTFPPCCHCRTTMFPFKDQNGITHYSGTPPVIEPIITQFIRMRPANPKPTQPPASRPVT